MSMSVDEARQERSRMMRRCVHEAHLAARDGDEARLRHCLSEAQSLPDDEECQHMIDTIQAMLEQLQGTEAPGSLVGRVVFISGLKTRDDLNSAEGTALSYDAAASRYVVQVEREQVRLKPENLSTMPKGHTEQSVEGMQMLGDFVEICNMTVRTELNGKHGIVTCYHDPFGRVHEDVATRTKVAGASGTGDWRGPNQFGIKLPDNTIVHVRKEQMMTDKDQHAAMRAQMHANGPPPWYRVAAVGVGLAAYAGLLLYLGKRAWSWIGGRAT